MLEALNYWRKTGIVIGDGTYKIHAFGSIDWKNHEEVKACIYNLSGIYVGFQVPQSAEDQFSLGQPWLYMAGSPIIGGHAIYIPQYLDSLTTNDVGPVCITWGKHQQITWDFWDRYVDEAYGIVDERDAWLGDKSPVDINALDAKLAEITK